LRREAVDRIAADRADGEGDVGVDAEVRGETGRPRLRSATWVAAHAGLWLLVGAGATLLFANGRTRRPGLADAVDRATERLRMLELSQSQQAALDAIRNEWRDAVLQEERSYGDRIFSAARSADDRIAALLTDAQRSKYRELSLPAPPK
jgi:hypothetical protein